jgi:tetratricopeptide (TPR) repeat protein
MIPQGPLFLMLEKRIMDSDIKDKMLKTHYKLLDEFEKTVFDNYQANFLNLSFKITNALLNLYLHRYDFWIAKEMYDDGILECQRMIKIFPDYVKGYIGLGNIHCIMRRYDSAMDIYHQALKLFPAESEIYNNIGNVYLEQNEIEKAVEMYKESIKFNSDSKDAHFNLGMAYMKLGYFKDAEKEFVKSIKIYPNDDESHKQLSFIYLYHLNNNDKALFHLKKVLEINPDSSDRDEIKKIINQLQEK